jgi:hypothetical protein
MGYVHAESLTPFAARRSGEERNQKPGSLLGSRNEGGQLAIPTA